MTVVIFVVAAAATCLLLGYWQLGRFESASGTYQNLGYALQWPLFAAFCVYGYRRFIALEDQQDDDPPARSAPAADDETPQGAGRPDNASADREPAIADGSTAGHAPTSSGRTAHPSDETRAGRSRGAHLVDVLLGRQRQATPSISEIPADLLPGRPTPSARADDIDSSPDRALLEYNDYLAQLDKRTTEGRGR